jgi:ParB-like chromosome segregation protein Spo0J
MLKEMSAENEARLENAVLKHGFIYPPFVWEKPSGGHALLDGHQRIRILRRLRDAGHPVPEEVPAVIVPAKNEKDAKEKLLLAVSQYGHVLFEGLDQYIQTSNLDVQKLADLVRLPDVDLSTLMPDGIDLLPFEDLEQELQQLEEFEDTTISIIVPRRHVEQVTEWLRNGESAGHGITAAALGRGVLKRCGLL